MGSYEYKPIILIIMLKLFLAILMGLATPTSSTSNSSDGCELENCECTDGNCDTPPCDDTGGETGQVPPKK